MLNHLRGIPRDTAGATIAGIQLPAFEVPGLPIRLDPGAGVTQLGFNLNGDTIHARFGLRSRNVKWARDTAAQGLTNTTIDDLIWRTVSGISDLELEARLSGELHRPSLAVRSNLDQAIASRLRAVVGEEVAAAERQVRERVDALLKEKVDPVRARVTTLQAQANAQIARQRAQVDKLQKDLEQRLRELTRIRLPGTP
jgi:hypothetical protein